MHLAAISAMLEYKDNAEICEPGMDLIYWLQFAIDDEYVQRTMCSQTLRIAIDAGLDEFDRKIDLSDEKEMQKVLDIPSVLSAFRQDPIMGVLQNTWERHKDSNQFIADCGTGVQCFVIGRHRRECKFLKCSNCEKNLPKKRERLLCSSCRLVIYCSGRCQKKHWKKEHKLKCKCKQATGSIRQ
uniref:MYND-type domain-containing protein n=1 Tax=Proboscia inermis TaxID=420281 RepID=A0A7S0CII9_9STRA|mmetsp:Transcript_49233/g.49583  ORF Transcript_49233/g.49583 Transcript_49233/m.49583 type:complete len:184 (+) Transcript_49233:232-783(+)